MEEFLDVRFKQGAVIEFLTAEKFLPLISQTNASRLWWSVCWCEHKYQTFMKIRPVGAELFHADRRKDMAKLIVAYRNFANASKKLAL